MEHRPYLRACPSELISWKSRLHSLRVQFNAEELGYVPADVLLGVDFEAEIAAEAVELVFVMGRVSGGGEDGEVVKVVEDVKPPENRC